jgi:hypothetical protein
MLLPQAAARNLVLLVMCYQLADAITSRAWPLWHCLLHCVYRSNGMDMHP